MTKKKGMKYEKLAKTYEDLEKHSSTLKKTEILAEFMENLKDEGNSEIVYLLQGRAFPDYEKKELGISENLMQDALKKATGASEDKITDEWKEKGDLGLVAEELVKKKSQKTLSKKQLTAEKVLKNIQKLPEIEGEGSEDKKLSSIAELISAAEPLEARYVVRTILHDLRIGVGPGTIRDAIVEACFDYEDLGKDPEGKDDEKDESTDKEEKEEDEDKSKEELKKEEKDKNKELVQEAYDKTADFAKVFEKACKSKRALKVTRLKPGRPVKVMLFQKAESVKEGFETVGKPALLDYKYDGFRMMINKDKDGNIKIFTRRLEEVTKQFPEVKEYVEKYVDGDSFILDAEAVGFDPEEKEYKPFQEISQRIKRKYNIEELREKLPVEVNVFDILYHNGESKLNEPFKKRRELIEKIVDNKKWKIRASKAKITDNLKEAKDFYDKALEEGEEGVMMKNLEAEYKPGSRVGYGVKVKPAENEMDLIITGADWGTGKRAGWLTSFYVSCRDPEEDKLLEVGKVSTGLKEKEEEGLSYKEMTEKMKELEKETKGRHMEVEPKVIVEIIYQNVQKSPKYSSGYALRFPRFSRLRPDKARDEIATINEVKKAYKDSNRKSD